MSTVYEIFNRQTQPTQITPQYKIHRPSFVDQLMQFANSFSGNPEQVVKNLISNGQMTQEQFNNLGRQASNIQRMINLR